MSPDDEDLEAYLTGQLAGEMGLRCALGAAVEHGPLSMSRASPPEPTAGALRAARIASRVEEVLETLTVEHRAILAAWYRPEGGAPATDDGRKLRHELHLIEQQVRAVSSVLVGEETVLELKARVRRRAPADSDPEERRRVKESAREARRELTRIASRAREAVARAREAYQEAAAERRRRRRLERRERLRRTASGVA